MKLFVRCVGFFLLLMVIAHCARIAVIRQERAERQLKERVVRYFDAVRTNDCAVILQMIDRQLREGAVPEYRQALCEPVNFLTGATISFQKIIISDDRQAAIVELKVHYAVEDKKPGDGLQPWIWEDGDWHILDLMYSPAMETHYQHFAASKNFDPKHPIFNQ